MTEEEARKHIDYKYFGDYEMSEEQRAAVDFFVAAFDEHRAQRIRDIGAQQWMTMCWVRGITPDDELDEDGGALFLDDQQTLKRTGYDWRSAVDIVDGVE